MLNLRTITFVFIMLATNSLFGADWPQWRGPERDGSIEADVKFTAETTFPRLWSKNVGVGFSSLVASDGLIVTMGNRDDRDIVTCLNAASGELVWDHQYAEPLDPNLFEGGPTATPTIFDGAVYSVSRRGKAFCFGLKTGDVKWQVDLAKEHEFNVPTWGISGSPLVSRERLYLNYGSHGVCLNRMNGEAIWVSSNDEDAGYSSPLLLNVDGQEQIVTLSAKSVHGADANTGEELWAVRWITRYGINAADPIVVDNHKLIVSSGYGKGTGLIQVSKNDAELLWRNRDVKTQMSPGILKAGAIFALDGDEGDNPRLVCFDPASGEVHWSQEEFGAGSLIAVNKQILALAQSGKMTIFDVNNKEFQPVVTAELNAGRCWAPPIYFDGRIYTRNAQGDLTCSDVQ